MNDKSKNIATIVSNNPAVTQKSLPANVEAEQALLGTILVNNEVYEAISPIVQYDHFFDPVHARIFEIISQKILILALVNIQV